MRTPEEENQMENMSRIRTDKPAHEGEQHADTATSGVPDAEELYIRIQNYFNNGGYFNPESMDHAKVRVMLLDIRKYLYAEYRRLTYGQPPSTNAAGCGPEHPSSPCSPSLDSSPELSDFARSEAQKEPHE